MRRIRGFGGRSYGKRDPMKNLVKMQEEFQKKMEEVEARMSEEIVSASAGGGAVRVEMSCDYRVKDVVIDEDLAEDVDMLRDLIIAAFNEALEAVERRRKEITESLMGDLGLPGIGTI